MGGEEVTDTTAQRKPRACLRVRPPCGVTGMTQPCSRPQDPLFRHRSQRRIHFQSHPQESGLRIWGKQFNSPLLIVPREHYFSTQAVPSCVTGFTRKPPEPRGPPAQ